MNWNYPTWFVQEIPAGPRWLILLITLVTGVGIGIGLFTFGYAKGFSYLSSAPEVCANCHIMQGHFDSWQKSSHHHVAVCSDCHMPHDFVGKYLTKADNGFFHSVAFTLDNFHEPIQIKPRNKRVLLGTCISCHGEIVEQMFPAGQVDTHTIDCTHCHQDVGHAAR